MAIQVISLVLPKRWGSPARKLVALKLADVAREDGTRIYPSIATIAAHAELSERHVQRVLKSFIQEGLLVLVRRGGGRHGTNQYRLDLIAIAELPNAKDDPPVECPIDNSDSQSPISSETVTFTTRKGDTKSPNPSSPVSIPSTKEKPASAEAGAGAPSITKLIWQEGQVLISADPSKPARAVIGKWLKRTPGDLQKEKLLEIIRRAVRTGTADPIAYVTKALDQECPALPEPRGFDLRTWQRNCHAAIKTKAWSPAWGPPPAKKGCLLPPELITPELGQALASRKIVV